MHIKKKIAALLLILLAGSGGYWGYLKLVKEKQPPGLQASGTIEATQVELCAKLPGTLEKVSVVAGLPVKKDQIAATIVRNDLVAQKERDSLAVLKARAQLDELTSGAREQEIRNAEIAVDTSQVNYDKAKKDYDRAQALFQEKAIPEADMDKAETSLKQSLNQLESARSALSLLQAGGRPEQIAAAQAELERNIAVLKASEAQLEDTKIICPLDGTVLSKNYEAGEFVQAGASVATVADHLNDMWIKIYLPTDDLPKIKLGQQVKFTVSGSPTEYKGVIEEISSKGEFTPKTIQTKKERTNIMFAVKIRIGNQNGVLKPGMPADVIISEG